MYENHDPYLYVYSSYLIVFITLALYSFFIIKDQHKLTKIIDNNNKHKSKEKT